MNEEIEYAEMLEIPVSTVNVVQKRSKKNRKKAERLQESLIDKVNEKINRDRGIPPLNDVPVSATSEESETERAYVTPVLPVAKKEAGRASKIVLGVEFAAICALCGGIFLTNVFMPTSAMNTFFRSFSAKEQADERSYSDFTLSAPLGAYSDAEITVSPTGVLSFTAKGHVYPAADGEVSSVVQNADGTFDLRVSYADDFYGVVSGLNTVYYAAGDEVRANIPVGYSEGESAVQMALYAGGELLNCFTLDEDGKPVWTEKTT